MLSILERVRRCTPKLVSRVLTRIFMKTPGMRKVNCKIYLICLLAMLSNHIATAQQRIYGYLQTGGGWGNYNTLNIGGTFIYHNWGLTYDYVRQNKDAENVPADDHPLFSLWGPVQQTLHGSCIEAVRVGYIPKSRLRFLARAGVFIGGHTFPKFFPSPPPAPSWFSLNLGSGYDIIWQTDRVAGIVVHPTIEWAAGSVFGLSSGIRVIITGQYNTVAIDFNVLPGKVGNTRKRRMHSAERQDGND